MAASVDLLLLLLLFSVIGMVQAKESWVARWQRLEGKAPGLYALKVVGRLTEELEEIVQARRIRPACQ